MNGLKRMNSKVERKYTDQQYVDYYPFGEGEEYLRNVNMQICSTRKRQICVGPPDGTPHDTEPRTRALKESAMHPGVGWKTCYLCLDCADQWLDLLPIYETQEAV